MDKGDVAMEKGNTNKALEEYNTAREMFPDNLEMKYWTAISLANNNQMEAALPLLKEIFEKDNNWRILTERLPEVEVLNISENDLNKILNLK
ncbi:MAG: tetratricopeptide repeat protein [Candidatus Lokiarchaeota archaeon]|nr:tetratricopeptide repeat protein [Candidatus Lokiarchaeota archaeon]